MAIHFNFSTEGDLLVVTTSGFDESLEEVLQYGQAIIQEALRGNHVTVLCDETQLEYRLGIFDTYKAAESMAVWVPNLRKAAVVCNPQSISDAKFWETVAVNRGLRVRAFTDTDSARSWLLA